MSIKKGVSILGSCFIDHLLYTTHLPSGGESLIASEIVVSIGGKASNQSIGIARLGAKAKLIVKIGDDVWGNIAISLWENEGVDNNYIFRDKKQPTGMSTIVIDKDGQNFAIGALGANSDLSTEDVEKARACIENSKILSVQLNQSLDTILYALSIAKQSEVVTVLNVSPAQVLPDNLVDLVDVMVFNSLEASSFVGIYVQDEDSANYAGKILIEKYLNLDAVIISLGEKGVVLVTRENRYHIPAFHVDVIDTTGAGDALIAGFIYALTQGMSYYDSVRFGCVVSSISVTRLGTWASMPTKDEVQAYLNNPTIINSHD